jgi:hypothetical protein
MRSPSVHPIRPRGRRLDNRRGIALGVALLFTVAIGALATSAIVLTSNASLMSKAVNQQRIMKYAADAALQMGKSHVNFDPAALPDSGDTVLVSNQPLHTADGTEIPNIRVTIWAGPTGSTTGQFGRFASVVAEAVDNRGSGAVRRLELVQESFAKFAYYTNEETSASSGSTIYFANGDELWGPVFSNDVIHIASSGATFHDDVSTSQTISGKGYGTYLKGYHEHASSIAFPSSSALSLLPAYANLAGYAFTSASSSGVSSVRTRIEFVATDIMGTGDSLAVQDGFFRVYKANSGNYQWLRGDWPGGSTASNYTNCGDWHTIDGVSEFFPVAIHKTSWFKTLLQTDGGYNSTNATNEYNASVTTIMSHSGARCYLGGDPHLVAVARTTSITDPATGSNYTNSAVQKGGTDTTFTPVDRYGAWVKYSDAPVSAVATRRPQDAKYLFPIYRGYNTNVKGVITFDGDVGVSGTLQGRVTLYAQHGNIVILDDTRYAADPTLGRCADILGLLSDKDIMIADNAINTPQDVNTGSGTTWKSLDDTQDMNIHAVIMAMGHSFGAEDYDSGPSSALQCQGQYDGRGCLYVTGGIIQDNRGPVGLTSGQGFIKRYSYDRCAAVQPPPYFPTTGRFQDNRYFEIDPVGFNATALFQSITPGS